MKSSSLQHVLLPLAMAAVVLGFDAAHGGEEAPWARWPFPNDRALLIAKGDGENSTVLRTHVTRDDLSGDGEGTLRINRGRRSDPPREESRILYWRFDLEGIERAVFQCETRPSPRGFTDHTWEMRSDGNEWTPVSQYRQEGGSPWQTRAMDLLPPVGESAPSRVELRLTLTGATGGPASCLLMRNVRIETVRRETGAHSSRLGWTGRRGTGGAFFLADPGPLSVEVSLWPNGTYAGRNDARLFLLSPDRTVVSEATVPIEDGEAGAFVEPVVLTADVPRAGVYALFVYTLGQRSGYGVTWGIRTNARRAVMDNGGTQGAGMYPPILLLNPGAPADLWFNAPSEAFSVEIAPHMGGLAFAELRNSEGDLVHRFDLQGGEGGAHAVEVDETRAGEVWQLHVPEQAARIHVDGVTRIDFGGETFYPLLPVWAPARDLFFPVHQHRWMLLPYQAIHYVEEGEEGSTRLRLRNGAGAPRTFELAMEGGGEEVTPVEVLGASVVRLGPGEEREMEVSWRVGQIRAGSRPEIYLRASPREDAPYTDYATIQFRHLSGRPGIVQTPIAPLPYRHERALYGYSPDYPTNEFSFDLRNRPLVRHRTTHHHDGRGVWEWTASGEWVLHEWTEALSRALPGFDGLRFSSFRPTATAVDGDGDLYTVVSANVDEQGPVPVLLHKPRAAGEWRVHFLGEPGTHSLALETFNGHNQTPYPPAVLLYRETARPERAYRYERLYDLFLIAPRKHEGELVLPAPVLVTRHCKGIAAHSGTPPAIAGRGEKLHLAWGETVEDPDSVPGVPTYVNTYDRAHGTLGEPTLVAYAPPVGHLHNSPGLVIDSRGMLHLIAGSHGGQFLYAHSLVPHSTQDGWTEPEPFLFSGYRDPDSGDVRGRQTYVGLVVDPDDTLHLVFRQWRRGDAHLEGFPYAALSYQRKPQGGPWEDARPLVLSPMPHHSLFYHRLSTDRRGNLYLSYVYRSSLRMYRSDLPGILNHQAVLTSGDGGDTWSLLSRADIQRRMTD